MAEYPTYTVDDVVAATGNDGSLYTSFIEEALVQATLLFELGTCLTEFPDSARDSATARYAILHMADAIYWVQPFQAVLRNPFNSETIGSYSYSKLSTAVSAGLPTGVSWFDIAVGRLGVCDFPATVPMHGGTNVFEETKVPHDGYGAYYGPADQDGLWNGPDTFDPPELP